MRILIADKFEQSGRDGLQALGCEISFQPDLKDDALVDAIRKEAPDVLVVRGTKVTEPMLEAGPVKLVVRAGAGFNTIDVAAASKRGIYVSNCPGKTRLPLPSSPLLSSSRLIDASLITSSHYDTVSGTRKSFQKRADSSVVHWD